MVKKEAGHDRLSSFLESDPSFKVDKDRAVVALADSGSDGKQREATAHAWLDTPTSDVARVSVRGRSGRGCECAYR